MWKLQVSEECAGTAHIATSNRELKTFYNFTINYGEVIKYCVFLFLVLHFVAGPHGLVQQLGPQRSQCYLSSSEND